MSKSMLVALVALFFSLTGWGTAAKLAMAPKNTVNTQSIVNRSIRLVDLHPSAVKALRGQQGPQGPQGPQGVNGAQGPQGPAGGFDAKKIAYVTGTATTVAQSTIGTATAHCPEGTVVLSGGAITATGALMGMLPTADHTGWIVMVLNNTSAGTINISANAACAAP